MAARDWQRALDTITAGDVPDWRLASICHAELEEIDAALESAQRAAMLSPGDPACWHQLGVAHQLAASDDSQGHYVESHLCFERAFRMIDTPITASALGGSAVTLGQFDLGLTLFRRAQERGPHTHARMAEAGTLLLLGQYREGWEKLEARMDLADGTKGPPYLGTLADLRDKTVVVRAEQGYGDMIQFMRYIPKLRPYCRDVVVEVHDGLEALISAFTTERTVAAPYIFGSDDVSVNIMSLPLLLGPVIGWAPIGALSVPGEFARQRSGIGFCPATVMGVVRDNSAYANSVVRRKRFPFSLMMDLVKDFGPFRSLLHDDLGTEDWLETAHVIAGLDLVITIDTAVAHLAASLGIETWVLQRFDHCWRWNEGWYSTARIFKQDAPGDWGSVYRKVRDALGDRNRCKGQ